MKARDRVHRGRTSQHTKLEKEPMSKDKIFVEPRPDGGFSAKHEGGKRAVVTGDTQGAVIQEVKAKYPDATLHVARVRDVGPGPDKYRKV